MNSRDEHYKAIRGGSDIADVFLRLFINRADTYATQRDDGSYIRISEPIAKNTVKRHFIGEVTVGAYLVSPEDQTTKVLCFDVDPEHVKEPKDVVGRLLKACEGRFPRKAVLLEASRYPDPSYHLWVFFEPPILAKAARWLGRKIMEHAGVVVEVFPKQDRVNPGEFGNLVKQPLGLHRKARKWSCFLDPATFQPLDPTCLFDVEGCSLPEKDIQRAMVLADRERGVQTKLGIHEEGDPRKPPEKPYRGPDPRCIEALLQGMPEGYRDNTAIRLACYWINKCGLKPDTALKRLQEWNKRNKPPLPEKVIKEKVKSAGRGGYIFGCNDELLKNHCGDKSNCPLGKALLTDKNYEKETALGDFTLHLAGSNVVIIDKHRAPIWSCTARNLQEKGIRKKLAERFNVPIEEVERAAAQIALAQATRKEKEEPRAVIKVAGLAKEGCYEAIYHGDNHAFLVYSNGNFQVLSEVHEDDVTIKPPTKEMCPYPPYGYYEGPVDTATLVTEVRAEYDRFIDADDVYKDRWTAETFLTYRQEQLMTVAYEFLVGGSDSGKSHTLLLMSMLMYRPLWGVDIPAADIYTYLSDHPSSTILEDEIAGVRKDVQKRKVYLAGYKQGAVIPRIFDLPTGERVIKYYPCFGFKAVADRDLVKDSAFMERFNIAYMMEGYPERDEFTKEDLERLQTLRNKLLKWRLIHRGHEPPDVEVEVKGRLKELWKPLLQVGTEIGLASELRKALAAEYQERRRAREETLEAEILKATLAAVATGKDEWAPAETIWNHLTTSLEGQLDCKKPYRFYSSEYGDITKQLVGYRLRQRLSAEKKDMRLERRVVKAYRLPTDKAVRLVRRYICSQVAKFTYRGEGDRVTWEISCPYLSMEKEHSKICTNKTVAPSGICKLSNLATRRKIRDLTSRDIVRLARIQPADRGTCVWCGREEISEMRVETEEGTVGDVCLSCAEMIRRENPGVEWLG
jgi:hypothetical protein